MKKIEKKKKLSSRVIAIILAAVLAVSVALALTVYFVTQDEEVKEPTVPPDTLEGEAVYNNYLLAYPTMSEKDIQYISVTNDTGSFGVVRPEDDGSFRFYYKDSAGNIQEYNPKISDVDDNFKYSDLFAIEADDGYNSITKLSYLCMALRIPYVEERIELIPAERDKQLEIYGFGEGEYEVISFTYLEARMQPKLDSDGKPVLDKDGNEVMEPVTKPVLDENGNPKLDEKGNEITEQVYDEKTHSIKLGDKTNLGTGYYFMVDDREYVYAGFSKYFDYALLGFNSFVNSILVSPGLEEDGVFSGFITANYYQWLLDKHSTDGETVKENSEVLTLAEVMLPLHRDDKTDENTKHDNGYLSSGIGNMSFDLAEYRKNEEYRRLINALVGKPIGSYEGNEIVATLTSRSLLLDFADKSNLYYEYTVSAIESVISDTAEYTAAGTPVGDAKLVKLSYSLKIDGIEASALTLHAVVDLSDPLIPADFAAAVRASSVGELSSPLVFGINYTAENAPSGQVEYIISDIVAIYTSEGKLAKTVTETSIVTYKYFLKVNGEYDSEEPYQTTVNLGTDTSEDGARLKDILKGRKVSQGLTLSVMKYTAYYEALYDFITYRISEIDSYILKTMISGFRFQNTGERDPYYGESVFENTLDNKNVIYGISNNVCRTVVEILSGLTENSSQPPAGLRGTETVAVGITPELMDKYGLYKNEIFFEIPRYITPIELDGSETNDYEWYDTVGFTLYISDETEDGKRYIASELYDIIALVDGTNFRFLDYSFVNFWARRELMLTNLDFLDEINIEMNMEDMKGTYELDITHTTVWWTQYGDRYTKEPDESVGASSSDEIDVIVTPSGELTENELIKYMDKMGYLDEGGSGFVSITEFYKNMLSNGIPQYVAREHIGIDDFKQLIQLIYSTQYSGTVAPSEQAEIIATAPMVFRMAFKITDGTPNASAHHYVYEFYRYGDSRVLVRLYQARYDEASGTYTPVTTPVSDFYITSFAFKKIIANFNNLFNLKDVDKEIPYQPKE